MQSLKAASELGLYYFPRCINATKVVKGLTHAPIYLTFNDYVSPTEEDVLLSGVCLNNNFITQNGMCSLMQIFSDFLQYWFKVN